MAEQSLTFGFNRLLVKAMLLVSVVSVASGCGGRSQSAFTDLTPEQARLLSKQISGSEDNALKADLAVAFANHRPNFVLVLSGGDAAGAYGCGVLRGWRDASPPRPQFDVVTGVSTGALMSTAAFLGKAQDDAALKKIYTTIGDKDVFEAFTPSPANSIFDTAPLRRLIAAHITRDVFRRVAEAHRAGRRLYVATVALDRGKLVIWPMSKLAADAGDDPGDVALQKYRRILLAAAAIPMFFPPVEIDGDLHVDAGLREAMFLRPEMLGSTDPALAGPTTVYAIVNGKVGTEAVGTENDIVHIGVRSLEIYTDSLVDMSLNNVAHVALSRGPNVTFEYIVIPQATDTGPGPGLLNAMFDPAVTGRLYEQGRAAAAAPTSPWQQGLPRANEGTPDAAR